MRPRRHQACGLHELAVGVDVARLSCHDQMVSTTIARVEVLFTTSRFARVEGSATMAAMGVAIATFQRSPLKI